MKGGKPGYAVGGRRYAPSRVPWHVNGYTDLRSRPNPLAFPGY